MQTSPSTDINFLRQWIGRRETDAHWLTPFSAQAMFATLGERSSPVAGDELPPLWHWLYFHFLPAAPRDEIGHDGHPKRGGFLPPVTLPRRMFAGARFEFHAPLHIGEQAERHSEVRDVTLKSGRSGEMVFVTVRQEIHGAAGLAISEEQDIVYREPPLSGGGDAPGGARTETARPCESRKPWCADEVMLFRYSALTFNGHRIHYDRSYAVNEEGYPDLVVQGPLTATLLAWRARELSPARRMAKFQFRAMSPLFVHQPFSVCAQRRADGGLELWAEDEVGRPAMQAGAIWR